MSCTLPLFYKRGCMLMDTAVASLISLLNGHKKLACLITQIPPYFANSPKVHERRSLSSVDQPTSQKAPCLEFPPFSPQLLIEPSWDVRDCSSRIRIMLSEQLIGKTASPGELDLGATNEIVCFSFQHAPKGVCNLWTRVKYPTYH